MKKLRTIVSILFLSIILGGMTSCEVGLRTDNGRHRGEYHRNRDNHHDRDNHHKKGTVIIIDKDYQHHD